MTHVQQGLSFEHALLDAMLNIYEGKQQVLTGAVDELTPLLKDISNRFQLPDILKNQLSEGASYFLMGPNKTKAFAEVKSVSIRNFTNLSDCILSFLKEKELSFTDISKGFIGYNLNTKINPDLSLDTLCYTDYSGRYYSSSAFGLHIASQYLQNYSQSGNHAIVINITSKSEVGLTLLERV